MFRSAISSYECLDGLSINIKQLANLKQKLKMTKKRNQKRQLADKVARKNAVLSKQSTEKVNPFELRFSKIKQQVTKPMKKNYGNIFQFLIIRFWAERPNSPKLGSLAFRKKNHCNSERPFC